MPRSWDKEAVGVSQVAESGTAFAYNQRILAEDMETTSAMFMESCRGGQPNL